MMGGGERGGMHGIFAFEAYGFDNGFCYLVDADFFVFANCGLEVLDGRRTEGGGGGMRREGLEWEGRGEKGEKRTGENNRLDIIILPQHPNKHLREIIRVYKLADWFSSSVYGERRAVLCRSSIRCGVGGEKWREIFFAR